MRNSFVDRFFHGAGFLFEGTRLLFSIKGLLKWAILPFIIDVGLILIGLYYGVAEINAQTANAITWVVGSSEGVLFSLLYYPLFVIFFLVFLVLMVYLGVIIASIIASPFNSLLAEQVLMKLNVIKERPFSTARWLSMSLRMFIISLLRAGVFLFVGLLLFFISFIPLLNLVGSFIAFLIIAFDAMDYSLEAMELGLAERFQYLKDNFPEFSGMAMVIGLTLVIPGLTLIFLPSMVVGAASVAHKVKQRQLQSSNLSS